MNVATQSFSYDVFLAYNSAQKDWTGALARRLRDETSTRATRLRSR